MLFKLVFTVFFIWCHALVSFLCIILCILILSSSLPFTLLHFLSFFLTTAILGLIWPGQMSFNSHVVTFSADQLQFIFISKRRCWTCVFSVVFVLRTKCSIDSIRTTVCLTTCRPLNLLYPFPSLSHSFCRLCVCSFFVDCPFKFFSFLVQFLFTHTKCSCLF